MRFLLTDEQRDFAASLRELLAKADVPKIAEEWAAGQPGALRGLWARLAELGVTGLVVPEEFGGLAASPVDLVVAFEELGRFAVPGPLVESIAVAPGLLSGTELASTWLPKLVDGALVSLALPPQVPYAVDAETADLVLVVEDGVLHQGRVNGPAVSSVDTTRRLFPVRAGEPVGPGNATELGVLAVSAELLGAGHALLATSVEHVRNRRQFGKPIGMFQAVKHRLADALIGLELARPLVYGAAVTLDARDVSAAKVACGEAAHRAAKAALQVHGALGYTRECAVSAWLTRVQALRSAWGTPAWHRARVLEAI